MKIAPCSVKAAVAWVKQHHRHLPEARGGLFAAAVVDDQGEQRGVAIAGRGPRVWEGTGRLVITRVATDGFENGCSALYGALCRAGKALGYREAWTYTLPHEPGTSLRAAGFEDMGLTRDQDWNRPSRSRDTPLPGSKRRWMRRLAP